ncbi:MAG: hypothetical protein OHK0024_32780 [Thalassobaculales bacterium]
MLAAVQALLGDDMAALGLRHVDDALGLAALKAAPPSARLPAAYVVPIRETAGGNHLATAVRQRVQVSFGVLLVVARDGDPTGGRARASIDAIATALRGRLLGWRPDDGWAPVTYAGAHLVAIEHGCAWHQLSFQSSHTISRR